MVQINEELQPAGSHHGEPDLLRRDIKLLEAYTTWVTTARKFSSYYGASWTPGYVDWLKSRLFWRIRSGKQPLEYPPPTCYSCPWYEVIEIDEPHSCAECIRFFDDEDLFQQTALGEIIEIPKKPKKFASVAQCRYDVIEVPEAYPTKDNPAILGFGPYRFKAWNGEITYGEGLRKVTRQTGYIQYIIPDSAAAEK